MFTASGHHVDIDGFCWARCPACEAERPMTFDGAKATAIGMASRFGADFAVFRMPAWPKDVFLVKRKDEVPSGAEIAEVYTAGTTSAPERARQVEQGDLF